MKFAKRMLMVAGAVALVGILGAAIAPKAAHGLVAALVQVVNTSSNPAITFEEEAQTAFVAYNTCIFGLAPAPDATRCEIFPLYSVPMGKTAVIESFSSLCDTNPGTVTGELVLAFTGPEGSAVSLRIPPSSEVPFSSVVASEVALNLKSYASGGASGSQIDFTAVSPVLQTGTQVCTATVSGHLE